MPQRKGMDISSDDREMFKLFKESISDTNKDTLKLARKALKKVVEEQLTTRQKQFIVLYYYKEMDMPTIAEMCGVNASTVSRTLNRARQNIFKYMKYYFND